MCNPASGTTSFVAMPSFLSVHIQHLSMPISSTTVIQMVLLMWERGGHRLLTLCECISRQVT